MAFRYHGPWVRTIDRFDAACHVGGKQTRIRTICHIASTHVCHRAGQRKTIACTALASKRQGLLVGRVDQQFRVSPGSHATANQSRLWSGRQVSITI